VALKDMSSAVPWVTTGELRFRFRFRVLFVAFDESEGKVENDDNDTVFYLVYAEDRAPSFTEALLFSFLLCYCRKEE